MLMAACTAKDQFWRSNPVAWGRGERVRLDASDFVNARNGVPVRLSDCIQVAFLATATTAFRDSPSAADD